MNDGVRTTTGPAANAAMLFVNLGTDAGGLPTGYQLVIERTPGPPYLTSTPTNPNSRQSFIYMLPNQTVSESNSVCVTRGGGGAVTGPGVCGSTAQDAGSSIGSVVAPVVVTSAPAAIPVAAVPTLTEWAMILFGTILAGGAALYIQRRRLTA